MLIFVLLHVVNTHLAMRFSVRYVPELTFRLIFLRTNNINDANYDMLIAACNEHSFSDMVFFYAYIYFFLLRFENKFIKKHSNMGQLCNF